MNTKPYNANAGITLVEVVVATALLVLTLAAFVASFVQSKRSASIADNNLTAVNIARQQMEIMCSTNYTGLRAYAFTNNIDSNYTGVCTVRTNTITNGGMAFSVKDICVTVKWVNATGKTTSTVSLAESMSAALHP